MVSDLRAVSRQFDSRLPAPISEFTLLNASTFCFQYFRFSAFFPRLVLICGANEKERAVSDRSRRADRRGFGHYSGHYSVREKSSAPYRGGFSGKRGFVLRRRPDLCARAVASLL